jgi:Ser/Thr protein kinase RdoA (MazF antagonist)
VRLLLDEAAERTGQVFAGLGRDPAGYGLVHVNLDLDNVLDHHGQARVIDFDDASWGHYALDLAIAVDGVPTALRPALLTGYQMVRTLPPGYAEHEPALLAGRRLFLVTWHLANGLPAEAHLDALRAFVPD